MILHPHYLGVALTAALLLASSAVPGWAANDSAAAGRTDQAGLYVTAIRGVQDIRTNPGTTPGLTYAHPVQAYFSGNAFLAVGTYKGVGVDSCTPASGKWSSYTDGETPGGVYFCLTDLTNQFGVGATPTMKVAQAICSGANSGWATYINGNQQRCRPGYNSTGIGGGVGLEVASSGSISGSYNIDVKHSGLELYSTYLSTWYDLNANHLNVNAPYQLTRPSTRRVNSYLGTLD
ncbi:hypothetical protein GCM10023350_16710 [Nocardioides endophyticus]|uniref:Uncharacterized protein n=2 Tax=Nocardioides endophyticus TaxID=1353775 RepID=A0ABP8YNT1_9ACTN